MIDNRRGDKKCRQRRALRLGSFLKRSPHSKIAKDKDGLIPHLQYSTVEYCTVLTSINFAPGSANMNDIIFDFIHIYSLRTTFKLSVCCSSHNSRRPTDTR